MSTSLSVTGLQGWLHSAQISPLTLSLSLTLLHLFQRYVCSVFQLVTWLAKLCLHVWCNKDKSMWTAKQECTFYIYITNASCIVVWLTAKCCRWLTVASQLIPKVLEGWGQGSVGSQQTHPQQKLGKHFCVKLCASPRVMLKQEKCWRDTVV